MGYGATGYVNGNAAGDAVNAKIAQERAYQEAHAAQNTPKQKNHPDLADMDRAISGITEMVRQVRSRVASVTDVLVGESVNDSKVSGTQAVPPTPVGGQMGALISSLQYAGYALQDLQEQVRRLENAVGV